MTFSIEDKEAESIVLEMSKITGESPSQVVTGVIRELLRSEMERKKMYKAAMDIAHHCSALPVLDSRTPEEIIGYDEFGLPN